MSVTGHWYRQAKANALAAEIDYEGHVIKVMLCTSTYDPNLDTHAYKNHVTNEVSGTNYSAGGATLGGKALTYTAADSFTTTWEAATEYAVGDVVRPTTGNEFLYRCYDAGTSDSAEPSWPTTVGESVSDNTVEWVCVGSGIIQLDGANTEWQDSTITARYAVIYDDDAATDGDKPLLGLVNFDTDKSTTGADFVIDWHDLGLLIIFVE